MSHRTVQWQVTILCFFPPVFVPLFPYGTLRNLSSSEFLLVVHDNLIYVNCDRSTWTVISGHTQHGMLHQVVIISNINKL